MNCTCAGTAPGYPQHESYCGQPEPAAAASRLSICRYCERYDRACGREHTEATYEDWSRTWAGEPLKS